jgi:hypothetical protein
MRLYANNFRTELDGDIVAADTEFDLVTVTGLPSLSGGDHVILTLDDGDSIEIIKVTDITGTTLTVERAQESTTAEDFLAAETTVELRVTAASFAPDAVASAFAVDKSSSQSIGASANVVVTWDNVILDTNSDFDLTNNRYLPTVAGHYSVGGVIALADMEADKFVEIKIYKGNSVYKSARYWTPVGSSIVSATVEAVVELNGTTDYVQIRVEHNGDSSKSTSIASRQIFYGHRIG